MHVEMEGLPKFLDTRRGGGTVKKLLVWEGGSQNLL